MDIVLSEMGLDVCLAYLDDVCLHFVTLEQHLERLEVLFQKLRAVNLELKHSKSFFHADIDQVLRACGLERWTGHRYREDPPGSSTGQLY